MYPERDHPTAPRGTRKVTGDSAVFPPGADQAGRRTPRADKPRSEPPSQNLGRLGYTGQELFDRMPAPAPAVPKPRREFDPERKARDEADRIAASMWQCMRCGAAVAADQISPVRFRMNQAALLGDLAKLAFSTERAAWVARNTYRRDEDCYQVGMCQGCLNVTGLPEGMGRPRGTYATYADANTEVPPALDITASPPPAFRRRPAGPS